VHKEQRCWFAQFIGQLGDCKERGGGLLALLQVMIRQRIIARHVIRRSQGNCLQLPSTQCTEGVVPHDRSQPTGKCSWIVQSRQRRPGCHKGFLNHVLGPLEVLQQRERRTNGEVLKALRELHEGPYVAIAGPAHQSVMIHDRILSP
jgi:hypothetical protein